MSLSWGWSWDGPIQRYCRFQLHSLLIRAYDQVHLTIGLIIRWLWFNTKPNFLREYFSRVTRLMSQSRQKIQLFLIFKKIKNQKSWIIYRHSIMISDVRHHPAPAATRVRPSSSNVLSQHVLTHDIIFNKRLVHRDVILITRSGNDTTLSIWCNVVNLDSSYVHICKPVFVQLEPTADCRLKLDTWAGSLFLGNSRSYSKNEIYWPSQQFFPTKLFVWGITFVVHVQ